MNTMKLTLGQAAKQAGRAKGTLSKALNNGQISGAKDDKGRWQIDPSELQRWVDANPLQKPQGIEDTTPLETLKNGNGNSALEVEVKLLREQIERMDVDRAQERENLLDRIEDLKTEAERRSREHTQAIAAITDQRENVTEKPRKGFFARLRG
jgi:hypothetical protein